MVIRGRITPVAVIGALVIMVTALLYVALNRSHEVGPTSPAPSHQSRWKRRWARILSVWICKLLGICLTR